jgi:hypothetical protein
MKTSNLYFTDEKSEVKIAFMNVSLFKSSPNEAPEQGYDYIIESDEGEARLGGCKLQPSVFSSEFVFEEGNILTIEDLSARLDIEQAFPKPIEENDEMEALKQKNIELEEKLNQILQMLETGSS